jgi:hypothetical protein
MRRLDGGRFAMLEQYAAVIGVLIMDRPMCLDCIGTKTGVSAGEVKRRLDEIGKGLAIVESEDRCRVCGEPATVFSINRA